MWDFFRGVLGLPPGNRPSERRFPEDSENPANSSPWSDHQQNDEWDDFDAVWRSHPFSLFSATTLEKDFQKRMEDLMRATFGFSLNIQPLEQPDEVETLPPSQPRSLRDDFLKPGFSENTGEDTDLDGRVNGMDVQKFFGGEPTVPNRVFARSVTIRTIRKPDGSIETVRTERDHTGREETTVTTQEAPTHPLGPDNFFSRFF